VRVNCVSKTVSTGNKFSSWLSDSLRVVSIPVLALFGPAQTPCRASATNESGTLHEPSTRTKYTYDKINRLATSVATGSATHNLTFSYDRYGNMTCVTNGQTNGPCPNYTFNTSTNQVTNTGFMYDGAGNLTADGTGTGSHTYQWDAENRMKSIDNGSTSSYTYNSLGQRVEKIVGSTYTEYAYQVSGEELGENNRTAWTLRVVPFAGRHLAHYQGSPEATYFMHSTKLGSTSQATDYTGAIAQDQLYYSWGQEWNMVGTRQEKRFARLGHRDTTETSLDPTHFRMFSSTQGRWLSKDPRSGCLQDPQALNRYVYVRNSPTNKVDPRGDFVGCATCFTGLQRCAEKAEADYATCLDKVAEAFHGCEFFCEAVCTIGVFLGLGEPHECAEICTAVVCFPLVAVGYVSCVLNEALEGLGCVALFEACVKRNCPGQLANPVPNPVSNPVSSSLPRVSRGPNTL